MERQRVVMLHIPKTGGTSMMDWVRSQGVRVHSQESKKKWSVPPHEAQYVQGHMLQWEPDDRKRYGIVLRDPAEWLISAYNHDMSRHEAVGAQLRTFEEWYESSRPNTVFNISVNRNRMYTYLARMSRNRVLTMLSSMWWMSTTEHLEEDWSIVCRELGIKPGLGRSRVTGQYDEKDKIEIRQYQEITPKIRAMVRNDNHDDYVVYEYVKARRGLQ